MTAPVAAATVSPEMMELAKKGYEKAQKVAIWVLDKMTEPMTTIGLDKELEVVKAGSPTSVFDIRVTPANMMVLAIVIWLGWMTYQAKVNGWRWDPFGFRYSGFGKGGGILGMILNSALPLAGKSGLIARIFPGGTE